MVRLPQPGGGIRKCNDTDSAPCPCRFCDGKGRPCTINVFFQGFATGTCLLLNDATASAGFASTVASDATRPGYSGDSIESCTWSVPPADTSGYIIVIAIWLEDGVGVHYQVKVEEAGGGGRSVTFYYLDTTYTTAGSMNCDPSTGGGLFGGHIPFLSSDKNGTGFNICNETDFNIANTLAYIQAPALPTCGRIPCCCQTGNGLIEPQPPVGCGDCCSNVDAPWRYDVDLGGGGWTDGYCSGCASIAGVYTVVRSAEECVWVYRAPFCETTYNDGFDNCFVVIDLVIEVRIVDCAVYVTVALDDTGGSLCLFNDKSIVYRYPLASESESCFDQITLDKFIDEGSPALSSCFGSMPATITIEGV